MWVAESGKELFTVDKKDNAFTSLLALSPDSLCASPGGRWRR